MLAAFIQHADSAAEKVRWVTKVKQQMAALAGDATATIPKNANGPPNSDDKLLQVKKKNNLKLQPAFGAALRSLD